MTTNHQGWQNLHTATEMNVKALSDALGVYLNWSFHTLVQKQAARAIAVAPHPKSALLDLPPAPNAAPAPATLETTAKSAVDHAINGDLDRDLEPQRIDADRAESNRAESNRVPAIAGEEAAIVAPIDGPRDSSYGPGAGDADAGDAEAGEIGAGDAEVGETEAGETEGAGGADPAPLFVPFTGDGGDDGDAGAVPDDVPGAAPEVVAGALGDRAGGAGGAGGNT